MNHEVKIHTGDDDEEKKEKKDDDDNDTVWQSCCNVPSDRRLIRFIAILSISIGVLSFCFSQLAIGDLNKDREMFYISLITMILGIWVRSPV